jgi:uncharacterized damage-inducible protein DinB
MALSPSTPALIAQQLREAYSGKNWTWVWLKETLADLHWEEATIRIHNLNSIATLVFHINYYIEKQLEVLQGKDLDGRDKDSFDLPPIESEAQWRALLDRLWKAANQWLALVEAMPEEQLRQPFDRGKYGNWFRNLCGVVEHVHYHLGQIVLIRKMIRENNPS